MRISTAIFSIIILISCNHKESSDEIIIQGDVKGIPDGKVYLAEAHYSQIFLDSTTVKDGKFTFTIKPDSNFYPYLAKIEFPDSNAMFKLSGLIFSNSRSDGFYLERGVTTIISDTAKPNRFPSGYLAIWAKVKAGKQDDAYGKNQMSDFGWLGNLDSAKRLSRIEFFKRQIKKYPYSYFLLDGIYNARNQYSKPEWSELLTLFDDDVQQSALGKKIKKYLADRRDDGSPYPNILLTNANNERGKIFDNNASINMIVFWASWCGPCREEIPSIKQLYASYANRNFNLTSVSVDENEDEWKKALRKEDMKWPQFIVGKKEKDFVFAQFDPSVIPLIIFTDKAGNQIARFVGYEKGEEKKYDSIIHSYLKK